jgi:hypothetical protein
MDIQSVRSGVLNERSTRNKETTNNGKIIIPMTLNDEESKGNREGKTQNMLNFNF